MKYRINLKWGILFTGALFFSASLLAQQKTKPSKKEDIVISPKEGKKEKLTIIVDGDNVTVNGKPIDQYNGDNIVIRKRGRDDFEYNNDYFMYKTPRVNPSPHVYVTPPMPPMAYAAPRPNWNFSYNYKSDENSKKAMLGITTEDDTKGAKIKEVMKESAAEKAGLKSGDIITMVDGKKVTDAESLSDIIDDKDPGDEVDVTYIRDKKTQKIKVKLGERKQSYSRSYRSPRAEGLEGLGKLEPMYNDMMHNFNFSVGPNRRLGIRIQEMEDSSGVKVLEVEDESIAEKTGIKRDDVITEIDGNKVKDTYSAREAMSDSREKNNYNIKILRNGSPVNLEVKIPKVLKKSDL